MSIEEEIFKKSIIMVEKLLDYGFQKEGRNYLYTKNILNNTFQVTITITNNEVKGKIIDLSYQEEYTNFRLENLGKFSSQVKSLFISILEDIKDKCTNTSYFATESANRITNLIIEKYNIYPEFLWEKTPDTGVFRKETKKWFGIIMNINKNKIVGNDKTFVDILNIKLDKDEISQLLTKKGFYKAYHMNKTYWLTIILDDTLTDEEIMTYIDKSYNLVK